MMEVIETMSPRDTMYEPQYPDAYLMVGESALWNIERVRALVNAPEPSAILDMPSGHGRVLRHLRGAFPDAHLTACDIDRDGVDFCAQTFGAAGVYSTDDPADVDLGRTFDLIWVGSLFTHLGAARWAQFLSFFAAQLRAGGIMVFSTHGRHHAEGFTADPKLPNFKMSPAARAEMLADFRDRGFGYQPYPQTPDYGLSLSSPSWVLGALTRHAPALRLVSYTERAWRGSHDLVTVQNGYVRRLPSDAA
jgi:SAM-dependent methyltransferase